MNNGMQSILKIRLNTCSVSAAVFLGFGPVSSKQLALKLYGSLKKEAFSFFFLQSQLFCHILWRHRVMKREALGLLLSLKWHSRFWLTFSSWRSTGRRMLLSGEDFPICLVWTLTIVSSDLKLTSLFLFLCLEGKPCCSDVQVVSRLSCLSIMCRCWRKRFSAMWFFTKPIWCLTKAYTVNSVAAEVCICRPECWSFSPNWYTWCPKWKGQSEVHCAY